MPDFINMIFTSIHWRNPVFQTTRPYTELSYVLGSKAEQLISVTHTQNRKSNANFSWNTASVMHG